MTLFVNPSAATNGTGTLLNPRNTWAGITGAEDSDFAQCAGTTFQATGANGISITSAGSALARKRIRSYEPGTGDPTKEKARIVGATRYGINFAANVGFWDVEDLDISEVGDGGANICFGITWIVSPANDYQDMQMAIRRCDVHDLRGGLGPNDTTAISARGRGNLIEDCHIYRIPVDGIRANGTDMTIRRNRIEHVNMDGNNRADCIQFASNHHGAIVEHNYLDSSNGEGKQVILFADSVDPGGLRIVRHNTIIGAPGAQQGVYTDRPALIYGNEIIDCIFGVRSVSTSMICGNLFRNRRSQGQHFGIWLDGPNQWAINNTLINTVPGSPSSQMAIYANNAQAGHVIRNNLIIGYATGIRLAENAGQTESYNFFQGVTTPVLGIATNPAIGEGSRILGSEALIDDRGRLLDYARDAAGRLIENPAARGGKIFPGTRLMNGRARPGMCPVGAYQWEGLR